MQPHLPFLTLIVSAFPFLACANDLGERSGAAFVGSSPTSEVRKYDVVCDDHRYRLILSNEGFGVELDQFSRDDEDMDAEVIEGLSSLVSEFWSLNTVTFICGAGPDHRAWKRIRKSDPDIVIEDFSDLLQIEIEGMHKTDYEPARKECIEKDRIFEIRTRRVVTVSPEVIDIGEGRIGQCFLGPAETFYKGDR